MSIKRIRIPFTILFIAVLMLAGLNARSQSIQVTNVSPAIVCAGSPVTITFSVTNGANNGSSFDNNSKYTIYYNSGGGTFTALDIPEFSAVGVTYNSVNGGTTTNITTTFLLPADLAGGNTYRLSLSSKLPNTSIAGNTQSPVFTVQPLPGAPTAGNNGPQCEGATLSLTASTIAGATYTWTGPNGFTSNLQNPQIPNVTKAAQGTYYVTAALNGCQGITSGSTFVNISISPLVSIVSSSSVVCENTPITLTATSSGGTLGEVAGTNNTNLVLSTTAAATVTSKITMSAGLLSNLSNLRVTLNINHTNSSDLKVTLTGPGTVGTTTLFDRLGLPGTSNTDRLEGRYVFITSAPSVLTEADQSGNKAIPARDYRPSDTDGNAHNFNGLITGNNIAGDWTLTIQDYTAVDGGNLINWSLNIADAAGSYTTSFDGPGTISAVTYSGINNSIATVTVIPPVGASNLYTATTSLSGCPRLSAPINVVVNDPGRWTGAVNSDYLNPGNWACGTIPDLTRNVIVPAVLPAPVLSTGTGLSNNLTIHTNASLTVNSAIRIAGNISNSGTFTVSGGSVSLGGSVARNIPAGLFAGNLIKDLTLDNAAGTSLGGTLKVSGILKATTGTFSTGGFLTLLSDATTTAMIDGSGPGTVSGNVTMQAYLPSGYGYKYISSPFQAATVNELASEVDLAAPFPTVYRHSEDVNTAGWIKYVDPAGILNPLRGYAVNFGSLTAPKTIEMSGLVNNGNLSISLFNHNRTYTQGFNLVGNPYPSPVDWNAAGGWVKNNIDNALYYFKASSTDVYDGIYGSYVNGISTDGGTNIIPAMQGFFVHVSNGPTYPVSATLGINNTARTTLYPSAKILKDKGGILSSSSAGFYKSDLSDSKSMLRMQAAYEQGVVIPDHAVIYFDDEASPAFDKAYDALKLMNTAVSVPNLYTISSDARNLSINALPNSADSVKIVPLGLKVEKSGFVNLSVSGLNDLPYGLKVYLKDTKSNVLHNFAQSASYRVNLKAGKYDDRFSVVFSLKDLTVPASSRDLFSASYAEGRIKYRLKDNPQNSKASLTVSNMNGQVLNRSDFRGPDNQELQIRLNPGIYVITCVSDMGIQSKKIFAN